MTLTVWRDSVHAGDDGDAPHSLQLPIAANESIESVTRRLIEHRYLPSISGGRATWILESHRKLAVMAEQWTAPRFLVDPATSAAALVDPAAERQLNWIYWCQVDPDRVFDCLVRGEPLPDQFGR